MNLQFIKYFVTLAETKNFTKAAEKVHVVQSTFSAGIKKLEEHLECKLFFRDKRNVSLTPEGVTLLPKAKKILSQWSEIESDFIHSEAKVLQIGILNNILFDAIIPKLKSFQEMYGQYQVHITEDDKETLLKKMSSGELDGIYIENEVVDEKQFQTRLEYEEKLDVAVPIGHPLAAKDRLEINALDGAPFIKRCNCVLFNEVEERFNQNGIEITPVFKAHNDDTVTSLISSGIGISLLSKPLKAIEGIKFIPLTDANFTRQIIFVWKREEGSQALSSYLSV